MATNLVSTNDSLGYSKVHKKQLRILTLWMRSLIIQLLLDYKTTKFTCPSMHKKLLVLVGLIDTGSCPGVDDTNYIHIKIQFSKDNIVNLI